MKKLIVTVISVASFAPAFTQNEDDALRYSLTYFGGSSRNVSTAGAFGAVGGDYSFAASNPAGLGRFKKHNFSFTTGLENPNTTSSFNGTNTKDQGLAIKLNNLSYIKAYNLDPKKFSNWFGVQMGLGYNRIHSFEERIHYTGDTDSSILHSFINQANGTSPDNIYDAFPFDAGLAYDTYAIDPGPNNTYFTDFTSGTSFHDRTITRRGGIGEYSLTMSGNYTNKLLVGGSLNFTRVTFSEKYEHKETFSDSSLWLQDIRYLSDLSIKGWGVGARIGAIYLPAEWLRIGLSIQSPTFYSLSDAWSANMYTNTDNGLKYVDESNVPYGSYKYKVRTPFRSNASLGIVLKKFGSVGVDVEYVDYSNALLSSKKFSDAPYMFVSENAQIENIYRSVFNYRFGVELRIKNNYYLRGGFAHFNSPFKQDKGNVQYPVQFITGGAGYVFGKFYLDAAFALRSNKVDYYAYDPTIGGSHASLDFKNAQVMFTLGFRFAKNILD